MYIKVKTVILVLIFVSTAIIGSIGAFIFYKSTHNTAVLGTTPRQAVQFELSPDQPTQSMSVEATKLPKFVYNLSEHKFDSIINNSANGIGNLVQAKIVHVIYTKDSIDSNVSIDKDKRQLFVSPKDVVSFQPGMYKLSLTLRTLEGEVHVDQDFSWGVIAVNTNKSIYKPGEMAKIGIGVLNDKGETLCMNGLKRADNVEMTITDPQGNPTLLSMKNKLITDSGKCGAISITNEADFQAKYTTQGPGIYQMKVTATEFGQTREIEDYFKVDSNVPFDVDRVSFPTRIYPPAPYPATFIVTPTQDYQGTVEDVVPAFFAIAHISDQGHTEKVGNFTHIIWSVNLKAGKPQNFTYFIQFPMVSPEFYLIGPIKIGNFEEARQWQIASDSINSSTGLISMEDNGSSNTWSRIWTGTAWNPAPNLGPTSMSTTPADSRWFSEKSSPITGEKLVAIWDENGGTRKLYVIRWDGTTWHVPDLTITPGNPNSSTRIMDISYEQVSGNVLFVYSDTSNQIKYYRGIRNPTPPNGPTWDGAASTASTASNPKTWIKLVAQPNSDNILLGYVNGTTSRVGAMVWSGGADAFVNELSDGAGTAASGNAEETFAIAWENTTGVAMLVWPTAGAAVKYQRLVSGTWSGEANAFTSLAANGDWMNASADDSASSNKIAIGWENTGATPNCNFGMWDGSTWTSGSTIACINNTDRGINVAFEHNTGKAIWVYVTNATPNLLNYRTWQSGSFGTDTGISGAEVNPNTIGTVELYSDPNTTTTPGIIVLYTHVGATGGQIGVYDREWDGTSWTGAPANPLFANIEGTGENDEAFGFGFDLNVEKQVAYRFFANNNALDAGSALAAQDTPFTLTSAAQQFRLRMLVYIPDALTTGARTYNLQYVEPGSGTCTNPSGSGTPATYTNVPTSAGQINFFNGTPANGATATSNGSDPTYSGSTTVYQSYNEQNTFTTIASLAATNVGLFDFSLVDNTTFGRVAHSFCFRIARSNGLVLTITKYPQITTAALNDVLIQGHTTLQGGSKLQ